MKNIYVPFSFSILLAFACSAPKSESENQSTNSNEWELQIVDSIQVDYLGTVNGGEFRNGKGVIFDFKTNGLIEFDETGEILNQQSYPKEGPGAVLYPTSQRYSNFGKLFGMSFMSWLYEFNSDLTLKREITLPFPTESHDGSSFARTLELYKDELILWYPGRDGVNPYDPFFFRDNYLLEKVNLETGEAEPIIRIAPTSRYASDKYYERTHVSFGIVDDHLNLVLSNEPKIYIYDLSKDGEYVETLEFNPSKFLDNGEHSQEYEYISGSKMLNGRVQSFFANREGLAVIYTEGIDEDIFAQNELKDPKNFPLYPEFQRRVLKIMDTDSVWSNEIVVPNYISEFLNIESLTKPFYALRNDDYIGEEQDYLTFYKLQLVQK